MDKLSMFINKYSNDKKFNEKIIKKDNDFNIFDSDEQEVILESIKENIEKKNVKQEIVLTEGEKMSSITKALSTKLGKKEYTRRSDIYNKLRQIKLPEQRSAEWFAQRNKLISASDAGCVLDLNKHEAPYKFIHKKVFGSTFKTNDACYHGKKFEQVVTMMYEYENDSKVEEFGLLAHETIDILGASPDGICTPFKRDGKTKSDLVGRMIEIKCPKMRKINYSGDIFGTICPKYYWCQVQQQLECCNLDECDFVQCNIEEYKNREEWLEDTNPKQDFLSTKYGLMRGVLIELIPTKLTENEYNEYGLPNDEVIYDKTSFLYPPKIDMTNDELDKWVLDELCKLSPSVKLNRIVYWRLIEKNCTLILREKEWFKNQLPVFRSMWDKICFLREHHDVAEQWNDFIESQYRKYNNTIMAKLDELIANHNK